MTIIRRALILIAVAWTVTGAAAAAEYRAFDQGAFAQAQSEGRPILVEVFAPWCPTCRAQSPIVRTIAEDAAFANLVVFRIDYDNQRYEWRALNVRRQSTLIAYAGARETGRLVAATSPDRIETLMRSAIAP
ncbi:trx [alpha proteobacterium U9-1i]|nr:trx [alpha proteobacterium U9-1i]